MKIFNYLLATLYASILFAITIFIALVIIDSSDSVYIKIVFVIVVALGMYGSIWLFRTGSRSGIFNMSFEARASHDLDEAMHQNDPNVCYGTPNEWISKLNSGELSFLGGYVSIWRYNQDHDLNGLHEVKEYQINSSGKLMLRFANGNSLNIEGFDKMYYAETFIKVMKAKRIEWTFKNGRIEFNSANNSISVNSNIQWKPKSDDLIPGGPAVFIWRSL